MSTSTIYINISVFEKPRFHREPGLFPWGCKLSGQNALRLYLPIHANGDLVQDGQDEKACRPDAGCDHQLVKVGIVFHDFIRRRGHKAAQHETNALVQPEGGENAGATNAQPQAAAPADRRIADHGDAHNEEDQKEPQFLSQSNKSLIKNGTRSAGGAM